MYIYVSIVKLKEICLSHIIVHKTRVASARRWIASDRSIYSWRWLYGALAFESAPLSKASGRTEPHLICIPYTHNTHWILVVLQLNQDIAQIDSHTWIAKTRIHSPTLRSRVCHRAALLCWSVRRAKFIAISWQWSTINHSTAHTHTTDVSLHQRPWCLWITLNNPRKHKHTILVCSRQSPCYGAKQGNKRRQKNMRNIHRVHAHSVSLRGECRRTAALANPHIMNLA